MASDTTDPLEAKIAGLVRGQHEFTIDSLAGQLGLFLNHRARVRLGQVLRRQGWKRVRTRRGGHARACWQPEAMEPEARELSEFLRGRENVTLNECCYALRALPDPETQSRLAGYLDAWGWQPAPGKAGEFNRVRPRIPPEFALSPH